MAKKAKQGKQRGAAEQRPFAHSKAAPKPAPKASREAPARPARALGPPPEGLFRDILLAPERESIPEAAPTLSVSVDDDPEFLFEIERRLEQRIALKRRGIYCGEAAVLNPMGLLPPRPRRRRREVIQRERWGAASPIFLPAALTGARASLASAGLDGLFKSLQSPGGLQGLLSKKRGRLEPEFAAAPVPAELQDPERDIERVTLAGQAGERELWLKSARLSNFEGDHSLRLRISFGDEGDEDASQDTAAHRRVGELAARLLPGARSLAGNPDLTSSLEALAGRKLFMTQHIAYWNTPQGGARFHHDAFDQEAGEQQLGVVYAQLTGSTFWLTLSIEDMYRRVHEFVAWLAEGDMPWLRSELKNSWGAIEQAAARRAPCLAELGKPSCGIFSSFVDGRDFSAYLLDAGHGVYLQPGDVLALPNHSLERTAMHSVFSASNGPGYALSVALRGAGPAPALCLPDPFDDEAAEQDAGSALNWTEE